MNLLCIGRLVSKADNVMCIMPILSVGNIYELHINVDLCYIDLMYVVQTSLSLS